MLPKREARIWANRHFDYVPHAKDIFPRKLTPSHDEVKLPVRLSRDATGAKAKPFLTPQNQLHLRK
jgi:hypothetical protein